MGEAKRRRLDQVGVDLTRNFVDHGKLLEVGFAVFAKSVIPDTAPASQVNDMKLSFMAGADHVWSSMLAMWDEDREPTETDIHRMEMIQKEIDEWRAKLAERVYPTKGSA